MSSTRPISTHYERYAYWVAHFTDDDPNDFYAIGKTEQEAIENLLFKLDENS